MTEEEQYAIEEFCYAVRNLINADEESIVGCRYALEMAVAECQILGLDPSLILPDGTYDGELG